MERIIRSLGNVYVNEDSRHVEGYALLFDVQSRYITQQIGPSNFISFYETISRSAVTQELIDNSDVFALFNHDRNKVLARSENGTGTLKLEIDDKGLKYSFDAPNTALGDELLELLKRGDIHQSSFSCYIDFGDDEMVTKEKRDGALYLTVNKISRLFDVSPVFTPAYTETTVSNRELEIITRMLNDDEEKYNDDDMKRNEEDLENKEQEQENAPVNEEQEQNNNEEVNEQEQVNDEEKTDEKPSDDEEQKQERQEETEDDKEQETEDDKEQETEEDKEQETDNTQRSVKNTKINNNHINMKKEEKFSLINAVRSLINNDEATDATKAVLELGEQQSRSFGKVTPKNVINIPFSATQRSITVNAVGEDLVVTDFAEILEPLRAENVMVKAGATFYENLNTQLQIPSLSAQQVGWAGEIEEADDSGADADSIVLTPHRLTATLPISLEFLALDSLGAEQKLRRDLINAVTSELENTMLSAGAATAVKPAGLFYGLDENSISSYKDICDLEAEIEGINVNSELKYIVDPKAKSALRNMPRSADHTRLVMENMEIDGEEVLRTTNMPDNTVAVGDWSNVVIAQFGAIQLIYNPYSLDTSGQVRLTVHAYFDFANTRPGSIAYGTIAEEEEDGSNNG